MPTDGGLQFLPSPRHALPAFHMRGSSTILIGACIAVLVLIGASVFISQASTSAEGDILESDTELAAIHRARDRALEGRLTDFSRQLSSVQSLVDAHVVWSAVLGEVQRTIEPKVQLLSLEADTTKRTVSIRAVADSYATIARQMAALYHSPAVRDLALSRAQLTTAGNIEFTAEIFLK